MKLARYVTGSVEAVNTTIKRFPGTMLFCLLVAVITIYRTELGSHFTSQQNDILNRIIMAVILGIPLTLCVSLLLERYLDNGRIGKITLPVLAYIFSAAMVVSYYFFLLPDSKPLTIARYFMVNAFLYLMAFVIPYIKSRQNLEVFGAALLGRAFLSCLYGLIISLGLTAIVFAVDKLLVSNMNKNYYIYIWLIIGLIFIPLFFLYGVPRQNYEITLINYPKLLKVLLVYVVMPLLSAYTIVLLIYFGQIIAFQKWPKGIITYLVLYYAGISTAVLFLALPFREEKKWVKWFCFLLPKVILLPLAMMFTAIGMRVGDYGITESRYYILLIGIWTLAVMAYLNFRAIKTIIIPISLAVILLLSVFGPWDTFEVSRSSQDARLYGILQRNGMLVDGKILRKADIPDKDKNEIGNIITYLDSAHGFSQIKYLPLNFVAADMEKVFGFGYVYSPQKNESEYFSYYVPYSPVVDISGYSVMVNLTDYYSYRDASIDKRTLQSQDIKVVIDGKANLIDVYRGKALVYKFDLAAYANKLYKKYGTNQGNLKPEDLTFEEQTDDTGVKIIFRNISGSYIRSEDRYDLNGVEAIMLIKKR